MRVKCGLRCHVDKLAALSSSQPQNRQLTGQSERAEGRRAPWAGRREKKWDFVHVIKEVPDTEELGDTGRQCLQHKCKEWPKSPQPAFYRIVSRQNKMQ